MPRVLRFLCALVFLAAPMFANSPFLGTFTEDDDYVLLPFSITSADTVTIRSYGYAGGTTVGGIHVAGGGFAPNAILFDSTGAEIQSDNGGHCGITGHDAVTGNCDDPYFQDVLSAGSYTLALVVWDNTSDGIQSDGFFQTGNPGFTCAEFGLTGNFCDVTTALGALRTGNYAVEISANDLVTPEPSPFALIGIGGAVLLSKGRRRLRKNTRGVSARAWIASTPGGVQ